MWEGCDVARAAADILARLQAATAAWGLSNVQVMSGANVALVCSATSGGRDVVVKLSPRVAGSERLTAEGDALALWGATGGAVELYDRRDDGYTLQLDRLCPGIRLEDAGLVAEDMLRACGEVARRLHCANVVAGAFPHLADDSGASWLRLLDDNPELQGELCALLDRREDDVLIHGDLHGRNILRHRDHWRTIDPQPVRADRHAEIQPLYEATLSFGPDRVRDRDLAERWLHVYTTAAGMDIQRARPFTKLRALIGARRIAGLPSASPRQIKLATGLHRLAEALR
jgi:streptomycin 6-kinase